MNRLAILLLASFSQSVIAANFYVAPTASGSGTLNNPGSLVKAMAHTGWASSIAPGDTVYLRGGTYQYGALIMYVQFSGSSGNPVTWRNYPNERAAINHPIYFQTSDYHRFQGLEFYDTGKESRPQAIGYFDSTTGANNEWINCIIHDTPGVWTGYSGGRLIRGCIIWYAGKHSRDHIVYPHTLNFSGNIVGWTSGDAIELGASGIMIRSNIMWGGGVTVNQATREILMAYPGVIGNNCLFGTSPRQVGIHAGGSDVNIVNNISCADLPLSLPGALSTATVTGNTLFNPSTVSQFSVVVRNDNNNLGSWTVNGNAYYSRRDVLFLDSGAGLDFATWKSTNPGYDTTSTASASNNPPNSVTVFPNADEPKRAHIAIYNWTRTNNVTVDVSGVLVAGDNYSLYSAQNFLAGPIKTGVLNGNSISVPMTNLTVAPILYCPNLTPPNPTSPDFGAFVLIGGETNMRPSAPTQLHVVPPK